MTRIWKTVCLLGIAGLLLQMDTHAQSIPKAKYYRLTFVLSYPREELPSQSLILDVPVTKDKPGQAGLTMTSGLTGQSGGTVEENLQCTSVQESGSGLAARVAFALNKVPNGDPDPVHHQLSFVRQIDVQIGKPTRITEEMHRVSLGKESGTVANVLPDAPSITVTATEL